MNTNALVTRPRLAAVNRRQMVMRTIDVERLIEEDHPARAIWELVGRLDLSRYYAEIAVGGGSGGARAHRSPGFDQSLAVCLQPGDQFGARDGAAVRI